MTGIIRKLRRDERGNAPALVVAGAAVFALVSAGIASGLVTGLITSSMFEKNAAIEDALDHALYTDTARGYSYLATLPTTAEVELRPDAHTVLDAHRRVEKDPFSRTIRVTYTVGKAAGHDFIDWEDCTPGDSACLVATELVADIGGGL